MKRYIIYMGLMLLLLTACGETLQNSGGEDDCVAIELRSAVDETSYTGTFSLLDTYLSGEASKVYQYHDSLKAGVSLVYPLGYKDPDHVYYFYTQSENEKITYSEKVTAASNGDAVVKSLISTPLISSENLHSDLRTEQAWYELGINSLHYPLNENYSFCRQPQLLTAGTFTQMSVTLNPVVSRLSLMVRFSDTILQKQTDAICALVYNVYTEINYLTGKPEPNYCRKGTYLIGSPDSLSSVLYTLQNRDSLYSGAIYTFPSDSATASRYSISSNETSLNRPRVALFLRTKSGNYYALSHAHLRKALLAGRQTNAIIKITNIEETSRVIVTTNSFGSHSWTEQDDSIDIAPACSLLCEIDTCANVGGKVAVPVSVQLASYAKDFKVRCTAAAEEDWISDLMFTYDKGDYGNGVLSFKCSANTTGSPRTGWISLRYWFNESEPMKKKVLVVQY